MEITEIAVKLHRFEQYARDSDFSPDRSSVLIGASDYSLILKELASGTEIQRFSGHTERVTRVAFHTYHDQLLLFSGSEDRSIRVWDVASGRELRRFTGHQDSIWGLAVHPVEPLVFSGSEGSGQIQQGIGI